MNTDTSNHSQARFPLGQVVITPNAQESISMDVVRSKLERHVRGKWGDLCDEDRQANEDALERGSRLLSVYYDGNTKFYIITEADRSSTCILLPEDY